MSKHHEIAACRGHGIKAELLYHLSTRQTCVVSLRSDRFCPDERLMFRLINDSVQVSALNGLNFAWLPCSYS
jgi:hypothetical protein